jgi:hypothetical protein
MGTLSEIFTPIFGFCMIFLNIRIKVADDFSFTLLELIVSCFLLFITSYLAFGIGAKRGGK